MKEILIQALQAAGDVQMKSFQAVKKFREKESISSIVTETDLESEQKIIGIIEEYFPQHNILSEECGIRNRSSAYTWVIDPLDGTSNYAAGIPWFGVLIALMKDAVPVLAGAYLPAQEMLYLAEKGMGSSVNNRPLIIENRELKDSLAAFSTDYSNDEQSLQQALRIYAYLIQHARNVRSTNCLLDLLYVAEGKFGGCINMFTRIWDIASLYLIITEAGGVFKSLGFTDIAFSIDGESIRRNYPIITGNNLFIEQVFKAIG